jgi:hypothetical protein
MDRKIMPDDSDLKNGRNAMINTVSPARDIACGGGRVTH